jgi:energy-coupling factor transporter ATP-binding protein EcfA2
MVTRTAHKGKHKGENFWGCKQYPACKGVINFELKEVVESEPIPEPTSEPAQEPPMTTTNETLAVNIDFNGLLAQVVTQAIADHTQKIDDRLEQVVDEAKAAADEAATNAASSMEDKIEGIVQNLAPRKIEIDVTANGVTIGHVDGTPHMKFDRILKSVTRRKMTWMCGPTGSGKTTAAQMAAKALGMEYTEVACGPETDQYELFGHITPDGRYIEGKIRKVFEFGGILMLDEIDNSNPSALVSMNPALSNDGAMFPDGYVKKHPDFVCIAGANTWGNGADRQYVGRTEIDAATVSRFKFIDFDYDETAELDWAGHDQKLWVEFCQKVRHTAFDRGLEVIVSPRASINGASELRDGDDFLIIADEYVWNPMSQSDKDMLKSAIGWNGYTNASFKLNNEAA